MYKLVDVVDGNLVSHMNTPLRITYYLDKWMRPKIGKLFVFDTLEHVVKFCNGIISLTTQDMKVFECECENAAPLEYCGNIGILHDEGLINLFWVSGQNSIKSYEGTYGVDAIRLVREIPIAELERIINEV